MSNENEGTVEAAQTVERGLDSLLWLLNNAHNRDAASWPAFETAAREDAQAARAALYALRSRGSTDADATLNDNDLIGEFDAKVWAERFVQRVKEHPEISTDEGAMLAWFSSAILAGYDHSRERGSSDTQPTGGTNDGRNDDVRLGQRDGESDRSGASHGDHGQAGDGTVDQAPGGVADGALDDGGREGADGTRHGKPAAGDHTGRAAGSSDTRLSEALELCMGEDLRLNGCACRADQECYLHGVTIPTALAAARAPLTYRDGRLVPPLPEDKNKIG